jgi:hypothetical protein
MVFSLMIIDKLNLFGSAFRPYKAQAPLIVDTDGTSPFPVAFQGFQPVARRAAKIVKPVRGVKVKQLAPGDARQLSAYQADRRTMEYRFGALVPKRYDHG